MLKKLLISAVLLAACCGAADAATLADLDARDLWAGEEWTAESLKDRVVVVEYWGYN